jgi:hypothetical protein
MPVASRRLGRAVYLSIDHYQRCIASNNRRNQDQEQERSRKAIIFCTIRFTLCQIVTWTLKFCLKN